MRQVEIYFDDLTEEAQTRVMEGMGISDKSEGNFEFVPLAILDYEVEEEPADSIWDTP